MNIASVLTELLFQFLLSEFYFFDPNENETSKRANQGVSKHSVDKPN